MSFIPNSGQQVSARSQSTVPASDAPAWPVSMAAIPFNASAASESTLSAINTKTPALGAALLTGSQPASLPRKLSITGFASVAASTTYTNLLDSAAGTAAIDVRDYQSGQLLVVSTATTGSYTVQGAFDSAFTVAVTTIQIVEGTVQNANPINAAITPTAATRVFLLNLQGINYLRVNLSTGVTSGAIQAYAVLNQAPHIPFQFNVQQATAASLNATVVANGNVAHSSASSGNPVRIGGRVITTLDTTLAQGDVSDLAVTTGQQLIVKHYASAENDWRFYGVLTTTATTQVTAAGAASIKNYVTDIFLQNTSATATTITVFDGATAIWSMNIPASMALGEMYTFTTPLRGISAQAINISSSAASVNVICALGGYKGF